MVSKTVYISIYIFFYLVVYFTQGNTIREWDGTVQDVEVNEGGDVYIPCNTTNSPGVEIYWTKNESGSMFHSDGLFLNFTNINRTEQGEYICNTFDNKTQVLVEIQSVIINVFYKAEVLSVNIDPKVLMEDETYTVTCQVEGNPSPYWSIRNNYTKAILATGQGSGTFVTKNVTARCGDTGPVTCMARNNLNSKHWSYMTENITVFCSPRPKDNISHTAASFVDGPAYFIMNVMGYPYPNYTWSRDDGLPIKHAVPISYPWVAVLNFSKLAVSDFGNYSLVMENEYGLYTAKYQLIAMGNPEMPYNLTYSNVTYDSVKLHWTSGFDMGIRQTFYIMERIGGNSYTTVASLVDNSTNHGVGQNWTLVVTNLDSDSDITLTVMSKNAYGYRSPYIKPGVTFHTLPDPNGGSGYLSRHRTGIIVGVTVGSVAVIAFTVGMIALLKYRRKRKPYRNVL